MADSDPSTSSAVSTAASESESKALVPFNPQILIDHVTPFFESFDLIRHRVFVCLCHQRHLPSLALFVCLCERLIWGWLTSVRQTRRRSSRADLAGYAESSTKILCESLVPVGSRLPSTPIQLSHDSVPHVDSGLERRCNAQ